MLSFQGMLTDDCWKGGVTQQPIWLLLEELEKDFIIKDTETNGSII